MSRIIPNQARVVVAADRAVYRQGVADAGETQASLGRAATCLLNRASLATGPDRPFHHPGVTEIAQALNQLGGSDSAGALATIERLLSPQ